MADTAQVILEREQSYLHSWRPFYHPVATIEEFDAERLDEEGRQRPLPIELLGERLVLARLEGDVVAMSGTCPHRGTGLHVGWVDPEQTRVTCRFHGAGWCKDGRLGSFPVAENEGHPLPDWTIKTFPAMEKYGLVWVSLEQQPRFPILDIPEMDFTGFEPSPWSIQTWEAGAGRMVEAALDTYHFAFVHKGTIGIPDKPRAPQVRPQVVDGVLRYAFSYEQPANPGIAREADNRPIPIDYVYRATPNTVYIHKTSEEGTIVVYFTFCPVSPRQTKLLRLLVRNHSLDVPHQVLMDLHDRINDQDRIVVETMHPWELPTDLDAELQAYTDRPTATYRQWLGRLGIQYL